MPRGPRRGRTVRLGLAAALAAASAVSQAQQAVPPADAASAEAPPDIRSLIRQGRCADAVKSLNVQLKTGGAPIQVLAGAMFETGLCVKKDWVRAEAFYLEAAESGSKTAGMRLAAGYADAAGGADPAASLWWAHVAEVPRPAECVVPRFQRTMEPDGFVKAVQAWGDGRIKACAYVSGVVAGTMAALLDTPAPAESPATVVRLSYQPGEGRFTGRSFEAGRAVEERRWGVGDPAAGSAAPLDLLRTVSLAAARRYGQAPGMDPSWRVDLEAQFGGQR